MIFSSVMIFEVMDAGIELVFVVTDLDDEAT